MPSSSSSRSSSVPAAPRGPVPGPARGPRSAAAVALCLLAGLLLVAAAAALGVLLLGSAQVAAPFSTATTGDRAGAASPALDDDALGEAGGDLPDGASVDDDVPGITGLDPDLLHALRRAASDAAADDVTVVVNSGWRSSALQAQLLEDAVTRYGTPEEAARWVSTPTTSAHVHGDAVDVGSWDATAWLSEHGASYGLCQIYANETWHYELRPGAAEQGCPEMYRDPTADPRTRS